MRQYLCIIAVFNNCSTNKRTKVQTGVSNNGSVEIIAPNK